MRPDKTGLRRPAHSKLPITPRFKCLLNSAESQRGERCESEAFLLFVFSMKELSPSYLGAGSYPDLSVDSGDAVMPLSSAEEEKEFI